MRSAVIMELEEIKAEEIVTIGLNGKSDIAVYMIVATGRSPAARSGGCVGRGLGTRAFLCTIWSTAFASQAANQKRPV